ncbi:MULTISPECIES: benzoate-CoA ligase family protein [Pseudofrankia]|uniref:benzoate-CoA ligase family protein n=1 Tax=Pseudofrankia TaxID=2994363 RepID=UPI000234CFE0|nr:MULTISPECIES: benzoate-CoA ligase family protein [Pseudofrankia]OHV33350.1 benzoate--CoA ligase [Pseudofrankia sp. EUN1h]
MTTTSSPGQSALAGTAGFNAYDWLLRRRAADDPARRAVIAVDAAGRARELSYGDLDALVAQCGAGLVAAGLRREERFVLCMADGPELVALFLAGLRIGAVPVPVSTMLTGKDLATILADSLARLLVVSAEFAATAHAAVADLSGAATPPVRLVVAGGAPAAAAPGAAAASTFEKFLAAGSGERVPLADTRYDSPGFWLYTSGTTGTPKAAMHRHGSLRDTVDTYATDVLDIRPDDVTFSVAKVFFAYGLGNSLTFPFAAGATTVLAHARPNPTAVARVVTEHRPTLFFAGPTFYAALLAADLPADTFASVRLAVSAGEACPADLLRRFQRRFGIEVLDGIGSTEMLHIFLSNRPGRVRPGTTGTPVAGYDLRLVDSDGRHVTPGEPGQLMVRGRSAASGYWCRADISRQVFEGPWTRTGDIYVEDEDGYYTCLGRTGDVLKAGGIWVSPGEVEERLRAHPAVAQAVVVAVTDHDGLETPVACVVPAPGEQVGEADLVAFCREGLAAFKRPRRVFVLPELPLTGTGKIARSQVRHLATTLMTNPDEPTTPAEPSPLTTAN